MDREKQLKQAIVETKHGTHQKKTTKGFKQGSKELGNKTKKNTKGSQPSAAIRDSKIYIVEEDTEVNVSIHSIIAAGNKEREKQARTRKQTIAVGETTLTEADTQFSEQS